MTDRPTIALFSLAGFLLVLALLGSQLAVGGKAASARPTRGAPRRIYKTTVVERVPAGHRRRPGGRVGRSPNRCPAQHGSILAVAPVTRTS